MGVSDQLRDQIEALLHRFAPSSMRDASVIESLAAAARWFSIPGGQILFRRGDPSDSLYFVLNGVLGVVSDGAPDAQQLVARLGPAEVVGEMGCITGQPRNATVRALRNTELLSIAWDELERLTAADPAVLLSVCKTAIQRLVLTQQGRPSAFRPRTFSLIAGSDGIDLRSIGEKLAGAFKAVGRTVLVTSDAFPSMTTDRLFQLESENQYLIFVADGGSASWTTFCLRQSDTVLVAARGGGTPREVPEIDDIRRAGIPVTLILCWAAGLAPKGTAAWLQALKPSRHFHVRNERDMGRVARLLTGTGLGLVLSGGGARGLAHVGVLRALREHGLDVDIIMGTSMGSLVGAAASLEWEYDKFVEQARRLANTNPWFEITIPKLSLLAGRTIRQALLRWFEDIQIEDTPIPFACVSANLSTGQVAVHQSGSLETWIRASTAVPGVFPPVILGDAVHVDGGVLNNMPTDLVRDNGAGFIVAVDVAATALPDDIEFESPDANRRNTAPRNVLELLWRVCCLGDESQAMSRRKQCDVLIVPQLGVVGLLNFRHYQWTIEQGYRSTLKKMDLLACRKSDLSDAQGGLQL